MQYQSLVESTRRETTRIVRNYNAQMLSRSGFTVEDVGIVQYDVQIAIGERAYLVGNTQPCILEADRLLTEATVRAGEEIASHTTTVVDVIRDLQTRHIFQFTDQMQDLASLLQNEVFFILGRFNSVTDIDTITTTLLWEAALMESLFEISVNHLIYEMRLWSAGMDDVKLDVFPALNETLANYTSTGDEIRALLAECT